jgi:hypothetical protein
MSFAVPMVWREQKDHITPCYFCLNNVKGFYAKAKHGIQYPNLPSAIRPVLQDGFPIPKPPSDWTIDDESVESFSDNGHGATTSTACEDPDLFPQIPTSPHFITQQELHDLVRDLNLSQTQSELLASRLQGWNLLEKGVKVISFKRLQRDFEKLFLSSKDVVYCNDANDLFGVLGHVYNPEERRLFIDSSKVSLKVVLLHNGNFYPSVPLAYSVHMKQSHISMHTLLNRIDYDKFKWKICGDLKVLGLLLGMQQGYTKYCCCLCEWDSRDKKRNITMYIKTGFSDTLSLQEK